MSATTTLLDRWKAAKHVASDNAAALALNITRQAVSRWRNELSQAEPALVWQMAEEAGEDAGAWLALVESERARSEADRAAWRNIAKRLGAAAATLAVVALLPHHQALAAWVLALPEPLSVLGIMRSVLLVTAALLLWAAARRYRRATSAVLA